MHGFAVTVKEEQLNFPICTFFAIHRKCLKLKNCDRVHLVVVNDDFDQEHPSMCKEFEVGCINGNSCNKLHVAPLSKLTQITYLYRNKYNENKLVKKETNKLQVKTSADESWPNKLPFPFNALHSLQLPNQHGMFLERSNNTFNHMSMQENDHKNCKQDQSYHGVVFGEKTYFSPLKNNYGGMNAFVEFSLNSNGASNFPNMIENIEPLCVNSIDSDFNTVGIEKLSAEGKSILYNSCSFSRAFPHLSEQANMEASGVFLPASKDTGFNSEFKNQSTMSLANNFYTSPGLYLHEPVSSLTKSITSLSLQKTQQRSSKKESSSSLLQSTEHCKLLSEGPFYENNLYSMRLSKSCPPENNLSESHAGNYNDPSANRHLIEKKTSNQSKISNTGINSKPRSKAIDITNKYLDTSYYL